MTAIVTITNPSQLDKNVEYWTVSTPSNFEAILAVQRCFPNRDDIMGYRFANMVYFAIGHVDETIRDNVGIVIQLRNHDAVKHIPETEGTA